ncbi:MAG: hypothetical protein MZU97_12415 [Bacillus subtilis]|nr:hypothetical protein [Bacillus subtilis]
MQFDGPGGFLRRQLHGGGPEGDGPVRPEPEYQLGLAAEDGYREGLDPRLGRRHHVRTVRDPVLHQEVPLTLGVLLQLRSLEVQEIRSHPGYGAGPRRNTRTCPPGRWPRKEYGQDDQDDLYADAHDTTIHAVSREVKGEPGNTGLNSCGNGK